MKYLRKKNIWIMCVCLAVGIWIGFFTLSAYAEEIPVIYVESYQITEGELLQGEEITVQVILKNNSDQTAGRNIMLTHSSANMMLYPVFGESNQVYIGAIGAGETKTVDLHLSIQEEIKDEKVDLTLRIDGVYELGGAINSVSNSTILSIPIKQASILSVNNVSIAQNSVVGAKTWMSASIQNDGTGNLYDVVLHIDADIEESQKQVEIGELASGDTKYLDAYVSFLNSGVSQARIWFSYTDEMKSEYTVEAGVYEVNVMEKSIVSEEENTQDHSYGYSLDYINLIIFITLAMVSLIVIGILIFMLKRKK